MAGELIQPITTPVQAVNAADILQNSKFLKSAKEYQPERPEYIQYDQNTWSWDGNYLTDRNGNVVQRGREGHEHDPRWLERYRKQFDTGKIDRDAFDTKVQQRTDKHNKREENKKGFAEGLNSLYDSGALSAIVKGFSDFASHLGEKQPNELAAEELNKRREQNKLDTQQSLSKIINTPAYRTINNMNNYTPQDVPEYKLPYNNSSAVSKGLYAKDGTKLDRLDNLQYLKLFK